MAADVHWTFFLLLLLLQMFSVECVFYIRASAVFSHVFSLHAVLRHRDVSSKSRAKVETGSYKEDPELTAQLHRTLAVFEANLAGELQVACRGSVR